jgi:hypothetical protein
VQELNVGNLLANNIQRARAAAHIDEQHFGSTAAGDIAAASIAISAKNRL